MSGAIAGDTIAETWLSSLALFQEAYAVNRFDSDRGPCVERENVLLSVRRPASEPRVADIFPKVFLPLVEGVSAAFRGEYSARQSTLQERLYSWPRRPSTPKRPSHLNQFELARQRIQESPGSRFTMVGFWDPDIDPFLTNPVSPLLAAFRVRNGFLNASLSVRSIDAWMGGFPMLVGFAEFHDMLAKSSDLRTGSCDYFVLSYHVYEIDLPILMGAIR
ncbi:MAG TPA: thymidylate synthase [Streptosporangiaceae bacterium]|nr:thymidylate synthase [Streptosporangiaceae bacterium]